MPTLKSQFHIVIDKRKLGGERCIVSVNSLHKYLSPNRVKQVLRECHKLTKNKARISLYGEGIADIYVK